MAQAVGAPAPRWFPPPAADSPHHDRDFRLTPASHTP